MFDSFLGQSRPSWGTDMDVWRCLNLGSYCLETASAALRLLVAHHCIPNARSRSDRLVPEVLILGIPAFWTTMAPSWHRQRCVHTLDPRPLLATLPQMRTRWSLRCHMPRAIIRSRSYPLSRQNRRIHPPGPHQVHRLPCHRHFSRELPHPYYRLKSISSRIEGPSQSEVRASATHPRQTAHPCHHGLKGR